MQWASAQPCRHVCSLSAEHSQAWRRPAPSPSRQTSCLRTPRTVKVPAQMKRVHVHSTSRTEPPHVVGIPHPDCSSPSRGDAFDDMCGGRVQVKGSMSKSSVVDNETGKGVDSEVRTSTGSFYQRGANPTVRRIEKRLAHISFIPEENGEGLQILHYQVPPATSATPAPTRPQATPSQISLNRVAPVIRTSVHAMTCRPRWPCGPYHQRGCCCRGPPPWCWAEALPEPSCFPVRSIHRRCPARTSLLVSGCLSPALVACMALEMPPDLKRPLPAACAERAAVQAPRGDPPLPPPHPLDCGRMAPGQAVKTEPPPHERL